MTFKYDKDNLFKEFEVAKQKDIKLSKAKIDNSLCANIPIINKKASSEEKALCFKEQAVLIILQLKLF